MFAIAREQAKRDEEVARLRESERKLRSMLRDAHGVLSHLLKAEGELRRKLQSVQSEAESADMLAQAHNIEYLRNVAALFLSKARAARVARVGRGPLHDRASRVPHVPARRFPRGRCTATRRRASTSSSRACSRRSSTSRPSRYVGLHLCRPSDRMYHLTRRTHFAPGQLAALDEQIEVYLEVNDTSVLPTSAGTAALLENLFGSSSSSATAATPRR